MKSQKQIQGEQTKEKIYATSISLFSKMGYKNVTVNSICQQAGVAKGTFYVHYRTKEDIIKSMYRQMILTYLQQTMMKYQEENPESSGINRLLFHCLSALEFCRDNSVELTSLSYISNLNSVLDMHINLFGNGFDVDYLKNLVIECRENNEIKKEFSVEHIVTCLSTLINGAMIEWCFANGEYDIVEVNRPFFMNIILEIFKD